MKRRASGILMHMTSLPSNFGIGDFGPTAYKFVDFLEESRQSYWQILPLNPTNLAHDNSPYHSYSAFGFNPLLISPELLVQEGLLLKKELVPIDWEPGQQVQFEKVHRYKEKLFALVFSRMNQYKAKAEFEQFQKEQEFWLDDFALFTALREHFDYKLWCDWPVEYRDRYADKMESVQKELNEVIIKVKFLQFLCHKQWKDLRKYCHDKGIQVLGDIPIYVTYDSADVWTNPEIFKLDHEKRPYVVSGVPPDYFSETGQLWGNPVYNWDVLKGQHYNWWVNRVKHNMNLFDWVRIDHFRGLVAFWEVPSHEETAINGTWVDAPVYHFFDTIFKKIPGVQIIAEDLGIITPDVREVMYKYEFPGMKILHFAFGDDIASNPYIPHNLPNNCILYTGTHDNNTTRGWFEAEASEADKERLFQYAGHKFDSKKCPEVLIRLAMQSVADLTIFPMQDILGLDTSGRMNRPGTYAGNWRWQMLKNWQKQKIVDQLKSWTEIYGRD